MFVPSPVMLSAVRLPYTRISMELDVSTVMYLSLAELCVYPIAYSLLDSMNAAVTLDSGRVMMRPRSNRKSESVLFSPSSTIASFTLRFSEEMSVVSPKTVRFPVM